MIKNFWLSVIVGLVISGSGVVTGFADVPDTFDTLDQRYLGLRLKFPPFKVLTDADKTELAKTETELQAKSLSHDAEFPKGDPHYFSLLQEIVKYIDMLRDSQPLLGGLSKENKESFAKTIYAGPSLERLKVWGETLSQKKLPEGFDFNEARKNYLNLIEIRSSISESLGGGTYAQSIWFLQQFDSFRSVAAAAKPLLPLTENERNLKAKLEKDTSEILELLKPYVWFHWMTPGERKKLQEISDKVSAKTSESDPFASQAEANRAIAHLQISNIVNGQISAQNQLNYLSGDHLENFKQLPSGAEMVSLVKPLEQNLPLSEDAYQKLLQVRKTAHTLAEPYGSMLGFELEKFRLILDKTIIKHKELKLSEGDRKKLIQELAELNQKIEARDHDPLKLKILSENEKNSLKTEIEATQKKFESLKQQEPLIPIQSQNLAALKLYLEKLNSENMLQGRLGESSDTALNSLKEILIGYSDLEPTRKKALEQESALTNSEYTRLTQWVQKAKNFVNSMRRKISPAILKKLNRMIKDADSILNANSMRSLSRYDQFEKIPGENCLAALGSEDQKQIQALKASLEKLMKINHVPDPCCTPILVKETAPKLKKLSPKALRGYLAMLNISPYFFRTEERRKWLEQAQTVILKPSEAQKPEAVSGKLAIYPTWDPSTGRVQTHTVMEPGDGNASSLNSAESNYSYGFNSDFLPPSKKTLEDIDVFCDEADHLAKNDPETVAKLVSERLSATSSHPCPESGSTETSPGDFPRFGVDLNPETIEEFHRRMLEYGIFPNEGKELMNHLKAKGLGHLGLTEDELLAINSYVGSGFVDVNAAMYGKNREALNKYRPFIEVMTSGLRKMPAYKGLVRRGASLPQSVLDQHQVGSVITYNSFTSTSVTEGFKEGNRILIYSRTCRYIAPLAFENEQEAICLPGTKFKVLYKDSSHLILREVASP